MSSTNYHRVITIIALSGMSMAALTGCIYDNSPQQASLANHRATSVTLTITGSQVAPQEFSARKGLPVYGADGKPLKGAGKCEGDGFVIADTTTGVVLGAFKDPVCGDTTITVKEDGTITH